MPASTSPTSARTGHALLLPRDPDGSAAALAARLGCPRRHLRQLRPGLAARHRRRRDRRRRPARALGPARPAGSVRPHAAGQHQRLRRRDRRRRLPAAGPGRRGAAGGAGPRPRLGRPAQPCRRADPPGRPRTCSDDHRALGRHRRRQAGARPQPGAAARGAADRRQYRRRLRASRPQHLPRYRHADLCAGRARQYRAGLGPARRDLVLHGDAGRARRRDLVPPRRPRPGAACRAHAAPARGRDAVGRHRRCRPPPRHRAAAAADERRSGPHPHPAAMAAGSTSRTSSSASNARPAFHGLEFAGAADGPAAARIAGRAARPGRGRW